MPNDMAPYPRRVESLATQLWESQVSELLVVVDSYVGMMEGSREVFKLWCPLPLVCRNSEEHKVWLVQLIVSGKCKCKIKYSPMVKVIFQLTVAWKQTVVPK